MQLVYHLHYHGVGWLVGLFILVNRIKPLLPKNTHTETLTTYYYYWLLACLFDYVCALVNSFVGAYANKPFIHFDSQFYRKYLKYFMRLRAKYHNYDVTNAYVFHLFQRLVQTDTQTLRHKHTDTQTHTHTLEKDYHSHSIWLAWQSDEKGNRLACLANSLMFIIIIIIICEKWSDKLTENSWFSS